MYAKHDPALTLAAAHVVVFDAGVLDRDALVGGLLDGARAHVLDAAGGVAQLADILEGYRGLVSISLVAHGSEGRLTLGAETLDETAVRPFRPKGGQNEKAGQTASNVSSTSSTIRRGTWRNDAQ